MPSFFEKSNAELRKFGLVMAVAFGLLGGYWWWTGSSSIGYYLMGIGGFFLATGLVFPKILGPIEWAWMAFAHILGEVVSRIVLTVAFYLVITPIGLLARFTGHGVEKRPASKSEKSTYWEPVESSGVGEDIRKPY